MKDYAPTPRKTGRPLSFDRSQALRQAMLTFWRHGYETTSIVDLTSAMGITAPSLYGAFGDKRQLFLEAVRLYAGDPAEIGRKIAASPSAADAIVDMWMAVADAFTGDDTPKGCLLASATASGSSASADVQREVAEIRRGIAGHLAARIDRDIAMGRLPADADSQALAGLAMAVTQGMSVLARDGASREHLRSIARAAAAGLPVSLSRGRAGGGSLTPAADSRSAR